MKKSQRSTLRLLAATTLVIIASAGTAVTAQAAYIVNATETGGDVVFAGSGSIDLTALTFGGSTNYNNGVNPAGFLNLGPDGADVDIYQPTDGTGPLVAGPGAAGASNSTGGIGDFTGLVWNSPPLYRLIVPTGYTSGSPLSATLTIPGTSLATIGLTPGSYEWTWGSGANVDSFTLNVGAVPVPAAVWLFGSGLLGLVGVARRKARA
jgi:hypothetical protein